MIVLKPFFCVVEMRMYTIGEYYEGNRTDLKGWVHYEDKIRMHTRKNQIETK